MEGVVEDTFPDVKGWAYDPRGPVRIRIRQNGVVLVETETSIRRADVAAALKIEGINTFGFRTRLPPGALGDHNRALAIVVEAQSGDNWIELPQLPIRESKVTRYQDFDGTGDSKSYEKLKALRLSDINLGDESIAPLYGKSVLDLGCNEGFFCIEAVRQGATRVVGIDKNENFISSARNLCPGGEFICGSWWNLPYEKFDVILMLSAIHYEPNQKRFFKKLAEHLNPNGVIILECGVFGLPGTRLWTNIKRWDGDIRYPTPDLLVHDILEDYAVRSIGPSIDQAGDPIPRFVYHCRVKNPIALLISGRSHDGKTVLSSSLNLRGVPSYQIDAAISRVLLDRDQQFSDFAARLVSKFDEKDVFRIDQIGEYICDNQLEESLCDMIMNEIPVESELFIIEGQMIIHQSILDALHKRLNSKNIRTWIVKRL